MGSAMAFGVWFCGPTTSATTCTVPDCDHPKEATCEFALSGRKQGQTCDRPMCHDHATPKDGKWMCPSHARMKKGPPPAR